MSWWRLVAVVSVGVVTACIVGTSAAAVVPQKPARTWGTDGRVSVILPVGNWVYVGGEFSAVVDTGGVSHPASNLAVMDPATGKFIPSWQANTDGAVSALASMDGQLYLAGAFTRVNGVERTKLAAVSLAAGELNAAWKPTPSGNVDAIAARDGWVYLGGNFTAMTDSDGRQNPRSYVARLGGATGAVDTSWAPVLRDRVRALTPSTDGTRLFLGGDFNRVGSTSDTNRVAAVFIAGPDSGTVDTQFKSVPNNGTNFSPVYGLTTDGTRLYEAVAGGGGACTAVDAATGALAWSKHANGNLQSVRVLDGIVYCGGHFNGLRGFDGLKRHKLAAVEAATGVTTSFAPVVNSSLGVWTLGVDAARLYVGGDFTKITNVDQPHFAMFVDSGAQTVPSPPASLRATVGDSVVHLSWTPPDTDGGSTVQHYKVFRRTPDGSYPATPLAKVNDGTTYADTSVTNGNTYLYVVVAHNSLGDSGRSPEVSATPQIIQPSPPGAPTGLTATGGSGSVQLTWTAPADTGGSPITGYRIYRGTAPGSGTLLASPSGTGTSYTDSAISAGTTYYYTVTAVNANGEGPASNEASATPSAGVPGSPTLTASVEGNVVHLSWTPPASDGGSPITKYRIVRDSLGWTVPVTPTTYDDTTASSGTHVYKVRAVNAVGGGPYSNPVTVTVP